MPRLVKLGLLAALALVGSAGAARAEHTPSLDAGFRLMYELRFVEARGQFASWQQQHASDTFGYAAEAAACLFEEFYRQGVLTSAFFLDDEKLLGGVAAKPNEALRSGFMAANRRARELAQQQLRANPRDANALLALTLSTGMLADYAALIEKKQLDSLRYVREAERQAKQLLAVAPENADAYLALGAANYIIGCLPMYKRFFLWFGGIRGDRKAGMEQLRMTAMRGHYLKPFAKMLLALAALREKQDDLARSLLAELNREFPGQPLFARELALVSKPRSTVASSP